MGYLVLETGETYRGDFRGGTQRAGEVVFNTSHSGYEEMATDPSYFSQIIVTTASQQGNYGIHPTFRESKNIWINGFICVEIQKSPRDASWLELLTSSRVPVLTGVDTRSLVKKLRAQGTTWGAIVDTEDVQQARKMSASLIEEAKKQPKDWTRLVCRPEKSERKGLCPKGPRVAVLDFGTKENILRELETRCQVLGIFPSGTSAKEILSWEPDGILLSNGPGNPEDVKAGIETVRQLLGEKFMFGICMGHQVLGLALGAKTYKLRFGHRGSNHPIRDLLLNKIYVTSQNHGYNIHEESLPAGVQVTHINLNDQTVAGIFCAEKKCMSVQFHPESHPGPHDAVKLFDYFVNQII